MSAPLLSVVIPTHNPDRDRFRRTLDALQQQDLDRDAWELTVVDNASSDRDWVPSFDFRWQARSRLVREERLGLTWARLAGINASQGQYLVFVDDDNVLEPDYLRQAIAIFEQYPHVGAIGGKLLPEFEVEPALWVREFDRFLALRDLGDAIRIYPDTDAPDERKQHPPYLPVGAGMGIRRSAIATYVKRLHQEGTASVLDRTGKRLTSGGDCDINFSLMAAGWQLGYFPQLQLAHLIAAGRLTRDYLARLNYHSSRSWCQVLDRYDACPWPPIPSWTVPLRSLKSYFVQQAWRDPVAYIRWRGACGQFEGQALLTRRQARRKRMLLSDF